MYCLTSDEFYHDIIFKKNPKKQKTIRSITFMCKSCSEIRNYLLLLLILGGITKGRKDIFI